MGYRCPHCEVVTTHRHNLVTHLRGRKANGGHELDEREARRLAAVSFEAAAAPLAKNPGQSDDRVESARPRRFVTDGHGRSLALLQNTRAARETIAAYRDGIGADVYLRPTDKGLTVLSLDDVRCRSMIGVGGRNTFDHILLQCPPTPEHLERAVAGYLSKRADLKRESIEEKFAIGLIGRSLRDQLRLRTTGWRFLAQEWRLPGKGSGAKVDLLAVDVEQRRLVVVELKKDALTGRDAMPEAQGYAEAIWEGRTALYPFFDQLFHAMAAVYAPEQGFAEFELDPDEAPGAVGWWPGYTPTTYQVSSSTTDQSGA